MSDKSAREAELEALRNAKAATNQVQKLGENAVMPVNMIDWEAQQKARKEEERMKKAEAALSLHTFRGTGSSEIESNLANLKKEDRQKYLDAENTRHNYRANMDIVGKGMKKSAIPKADQLTEPAQLGAEENITDALVSELADGFSKTRKDDEIIAGTAPNMNFKRVDDTNLKPESSAWSMNVSSQDAEVVSGTALYMNAEGTEECSRDTGNSLAVSDPFSELMESNVIVEPVASKQDVSSPDDGVFVENPGENMIDALEESMEDAEPALTDDWVDVEPPWVSQPAPPGGEDEWSTMTTKHSNTLTSNIAAPVRPVRLDVDFYFVLLTKSPSPEVLRYMVGITRVVGALLQNGMTMGTSGIVSLQRPFAPYVRNVEIDEAYVDSQGKQDVHKLVIHASLPVFLAHSTGGGADARHGVLQLLRQVIENGSLLAAATTDSSPV